MEIKEKVQIEGDNGKEQIDAIIDTGAEVSVIDEEILIKIGAKHLFNLDIVTAGEPVGKKAYYALRSVKVRNCKIPGINVIGGKKNLLGEDILVRGKAKIDEEKHKVDFPNWDRDYIEI